MIPSIAAPRVLAGLLCTLPCDAALLVHEPFDYVEGAVTGQAGGAGWAAAWTQDGGSCRVSPDFLGYTDAGHRSLMVSGRTLDTAGATTTRSFRVVSGAPFDDAWISFLYRLPAANSLFEGVNFYQGETSVFAVSNASTTSTATITLNNFALASAQPAGVGTFGQTHLIVLHLTVDATDGVDRVELFVDPPLTGPTGEANATIEAPDLQFDRLRVAGQNGASLQIDELRIGNTFADVTPFSTLDSDGDGLTDEQELEVGLNPGVPETDLIQAIRDNPGFFDLHDLDGIHALAGHGAIAPASDGTADLIFEIQQSPDLSNWMPYETVKRPFALPAGKNFIRLQVITEAP